MADSPEITVLLDRVFYEALLEIEARVAAYRDAVDGLAAQVNILAGRLREVERCAGMVVTIGSNGHKGH